MNVCIVGTGYVGLVTAACLAEMGNQIICVDKNPAIVAGLKDGNIHIFEPGLEAMVQRNQGEGRLQFSDTLAEGLEHADFVFSCVGTPPLADGSADLSQVRAVAHEIGALITK